MKATLISIKAQIIETEVSFDFDGEIITATVLHSPVTLENVKAGLLNTAYNKRREALGLLGQDALELLAECDEAVNALDLSDCFRNGKGDH